MAAAAVPAGPRGGRVLGNMREFNGDPRRFDDPTAFRPVGNYFAAMEAVLVLAAVARRFRLRLVPGRKVELLPAMSLRPKSGVPMRLERR